MGGEGLIWMEFTKVSPNPSAPKKPRLLSWPDRKGVVVPLEEKKLGKTVGYYLHKAFPGKDIRSSIPDAVESARRDAFEAAESAGASAEATERSRSFIGVATLVALVLGVLTAVGVVATIYSLFTNLDLRIDSLTTSSASSLNVEGGEELVKRIALLESQVDELAEVVWVALLIPAALVAFGIAVLLFWEFRRRPGSRHHLAIIASRKARPSEDQQ